MRIRKPNNRQIPDDLPDNFELFSGKILWNANKALDYRHRVSELILTLDKFLVNKGFMGPRQEVIQPSEYSIKKSDISHSGFEFLWRYLNGYLAHLEGTARASNVEYLDKCWEKHNA